MATTKVKRTTTQTIEKKPGFFDRLQNDLEKNNSLLNLILGGLIVIVVGILVFNFFNRERTDGDLGPSQQATNQTPEANPQTGDVAKENLPGTYVVKEGDTLFTIAQAYYGDGYQYSLIKDANSLTNENAIEVGQTLNIPKAEEGNIAQASTTPEASALPTTAPEIAQASPTAGPTMAPQISQTNPTTPVEGGTGGAVNQSVWGEKISGNTYTVQEGDWLSTIAGRAYGDIMSYDKLASANNIANPDIITPGTVLQIPR